VRLPPSNLHGRSVADKFIYEVVVEEARIHLVALWSLFQLRGVWGRGLLTWRSLLVKFCDVWSA
jgi:hypothetical protein